MKFSFKKIAAGSLALALALSMAACAKKDAGDGTESSTDTTPPSSSISIPEFDYMGEDLTQYVTLGKYKGFEISIPQKQVVTEEDIDEQIKYDFIGSKMTVKITSRAVTDKDTVSISYKGFMDGVQFEGGTGDKDYFTIYDGGGFIDGFASGLVGAMPGTEVDLNIKFPENYSKTEFAGKPVLFKVTVHHIYEAKPLVDSTAIELTGDDTMTVSSLREMYRTKMEERIDTYYENYKISIAWQRVLNMATEITLPEDLVNGYYQAELQYYQAYADMYGVTLDAILSSQSLTKDSLLKSVRDSIFSEMVIYSIIKAENITITEEEYQERLKEYMETSDATEAEILETTPKEKLVDMFTHTKAFELVASWQNFIITEEETEFEFDFMTEDLTKYLILGEYKGLTVTVPAAPVVTDEQVLESVKKSFMNSKVCDKITDRAVTKDDTVSISYKGFMDGVQFDGGTGDSDFFTIYNGGGFIDGFADGLVGAMPGTEVDLNLTFPEDYYEDLAGKAVTFKVTVNHIYVPAELTDENAVKLTNDATMTAEKLKEECRKYLEEDAAAKYKNDKMSLIFKAIIDAAQLVSPPTELVDNYYQQDVEYYKYYAPSYGMTYEEMLEYVGLTDESLRARAEANAMKDIAVYSIAKAENITISDAEYEEKLVAYAESQGYTKDEILEMYTKKELIDQFTYNAVYDAIESWQNIITE